MIAKLRGSMGLTVGSAAAVGIVAGLVVLFLPRVQVGLLLLVIGACVLGFFNRRLAWASGLIAGGAFALVCLLPPLISSTARYPLNTAGVLGAIALALALAGALIGALAGGVVTPGRTPRDR